MDNIILFLLAIAALYILFLVFKKTYLPRIKGALGEYYVTQKLNRLNKREYIVYNDIHFNNNGKTTQIDHLVLSIYGVFVIETKHYKGWIFGNEKSKYWTQTLYKKKYKIYNPIVQNWAHINFLKSLSPDLRELNYIPIVVFSGSSKLKRIQATIPVIKSRRLIRTIKSYRQANLSFDKLNKLNGIINISIVSGSDVKREHISNVKANVRNAKGNGNTHICPKCGAKLIERKGKYGSFQGCSNFPKCKFTKALK